MEKKKYVAPQITVIDIDPESILAGSPLRVSEEYYNGESTEEELWGD